MGKKTPMLVQQVARTLRVPRIAKRSPNNEANLSSFLPKVGQHILETDPLVVFGIPKKG